MPIYDGFDLQECYKVIDLRNCSFAIQPVFAFDTVFGENNLLLLKKLIAITLYLWYNYRLLIAKLRIIRKFVATN